MDARAARNFEDMSSPVCIILPVTASAKPHAIELGRRPLRLCITKNIELKRRNDKQSLEVCRYGFGCGDVPDRLKDIC
jgi:hypothetical protein